MCVFLQSIETFAVTVKEIAQLLQGFGSELSETELPDEANAIEFLLHSHTHRYRQMKVVAPLSFPSLSAPCLISVFPDFAPLLCGLVISLYCLGMLTCCLSFCFRMISAVC